MARAVLIEIVVTSPLGVASTLRFSDRVLRPFPPTDAERPNVGYDDRVLEAPSLERTLFSDLTSLRPSIGVGLLSLSNADGALRPYQGHVWGEIEVRCWEFGTPFNAATLLVKGLCAIPAYSGVTDQAARVKVALYDYSVELSKSVQSHLYAGSNGDPGVLYEGAADGLKGRPVPLAYGDLLEAQIPAPQVNAGEGVYQLHDGAILGPVDIFDRGDDAGDVDDGDLVGAAFDAATPAAAHYVTDLGRGLVKLNGAPVGQLTFGFQGDAPAVGGYVETAGPIIARILAKAGVPPTRIGASVAALPAPASVGVYAGEQTTSADLVALLGSSVLAAVLPDRAGVWQAVPFGPPAAPSVVIEADQVLSLTPDDSAPLPVGEVRVGWGRIWTTFAGEQLAPDLAATDAKERLAAEYRWAVESDGAVKARLAGTWRTLEMQTALRGEADAKLLALALKALFGLRSDGKPRRQWRLTLLRSDADGVTLGKTVQLNDPARGVTDAFLLIGETLMRPRRDQAIWTLWG